MDPKKTGIIISDARKKLNMTQDELAEKLFVTRQTVSGWENGRTQPNLDILCDLSDALECSPLDIISVRKKRMTHQLFVALIYEYEESFYKTAKEIVVSDSLCETVIKNTILSAFKQLEEFDVNSFEDQFNKMLLEECNKVLNDKLIKRSHKLFNLCSGVHTANAVITAGNNT